MRQNQLHDVKTHATIHCSPTLRMRERIAMGPGFVHLTLCPNSPAALLDPTNSRDEPDSTLPQTDPQTLLGTYRSENVSWPSPLFFVVYAPILSPGHVAPANPRARITTTHTRRPLPSPGSRLQRSGRAETVHVGVCVACAMSAVCEEAWSLSGM